MKEGVQLKSDSDINSFDGFMPEMIDFLWALRMNNNKEWMNQNRDWYSRVLKEPTAIFARELALAVNAMDENLNLVPSVSRINRDVRYSKDKSPYKAKTWVVLKPAGMSQVWKTRPAFFFELCPEGYTYGCGFYAAMPQYMAALRAKIDSEPNQMERLANEFQKQSSFQFEAEQYKRPMGQQKSEVVMPWYQAKSFAMIANRPLEERFYEKALPQEIAKELQFLIPYYQYFFLNTV